MTKKKKKPKTTTTTAWVATNVEWQVIPGGRGTRYIFTSEDGVRQFLSDEHQAWVEAWDPSMSVSLRVDILRVERRDGAQAIMVSKTKIEVPEG